MKLHLGCGRRYLEGYVNVDFPPGEHTVQADLRADRYADIRTLRYEPCSVAEIRLHHVFEHFSRPVALALLSRWRDWLIPGGLLRIETPDAMASFWLMISPFVSNQRKQQVLRHLFGSHEAPWAVHHDGWYREKFRTVLERLGYIDLKFSKNSWLVLRNIEVAAIKSPAVYSCREHRAAAETLLRLSAIRGAGSDPAVLEGSEKAMHELWLEIWDKAYRANDDDRS